MSKPEILLLDEPSLGLSPLMVGELFKALAQVRETKGTYQRPLFLTHWLPQIRCRGEISVWDSPRSVPLCSAPSIWASCRRDEPRSEAPFIRFAWAGEDMAARRSRRDCTRRSGVIDRFLHNGATFKQRDSGWIAIRPTAEAIAAKANAVDYFEVFGDLLPE